MTETMVRVTDRLVFGWNPNNKLAGEVFTAFVPYNPRYYPGYRLDIWLGDRRLKRVEILDLRILKLEDANEWIARLDTGLSLAGFREHLRETYARQVASPDTQPWHWLLLRTVRD